MTPTPNSTPDYVLDVSLPLVGSGVGEAQAEIVARLAALLPSVIDAYNLRNGLSGGEEIPSPAGYKIAPSSPNDDDLNQILVGVSVQSMMQGIGGPFKNEVDIEIYSINDRVEIARQVLQHWKRIELVRAVLHQFRCGVVNAQGRECWRSLLPSGFAMLPPRKDDYSGVLAKFRMVIPPTQ